MGHMFDTTDLKGLLTNLNQLGLGECVEMHGRDLPLLENGLVLSRKWTELPWRVWGMPIYLVSRRASLMYFDVVKYDLNHPNLSSLVLEYCGIFSRTFRVMNELHYYFLPSHQLLGSCFLCCFGLRLIFRVATTGARFLHPSAITVRVCSSASKFGRVYKPITVLLLANDEIMASYQARK